MPPVIDLDSQSFVLRSTLTSPFGRKVRMAAEVLGLTSRITVKPANTLDESDTLRTQNPLGKLPCLLLSDGSVLYDSRVIVEFLQEVAGTDRLLPQRGSARYRALTLAALADGITEAALLMVYEDRFRDADMHSPRWLAHQRGKIERGMAAFESAPPNAAQDRHRFDRSRLRARLSRLAQARGMAASTPAACRVAGNVRAARTGVARRSPRPPEEADRMTAHDADTPTEPPTWTLRPSKPKLKLPPGACDAHVHVFGPRAQLSLRRRARATRRPTRPRKRCSRCTSSSASSAA